MLDFDPVLGDWFASHSAGEIDIKCLIAISIDHCGDFKTVIPAIDREDKTVLRFCFELDNLLICEDLRDESVHNAPPLIFLGFRNPDGKKF